MEEDISYSWTIQFQFGHQVPLSAIDAVLRSFNSALLNAAEGTLSANVADGATITITSGTGDRPAHITTMRKAFEIAREPVPLTNDTFGSAEEALEALRELDQSGGGEQISLRVVKAPDGTFWLGGQRWASCEFDSQVEAEDALQAFEDPTGYQVIPFIAVTVNSANQE